jgi:hypothetical protein
VKSTNFEAPHYAFFPHTAVIPVSSGLIFAVLCSQILSVCIPAYDVIYVSHPYKTTGKL